MRLAMYAAFAGSAFQTRLAYRNQVWTSFLGEAVTVLAKIAIWTAAYAGATSVDGISLAEMVTYAILSGTVLAAWDYSDMINDLGHAIKTGDIAVYLLKPLHYPLYLFAKECGNLCFWLLAIVLPVVAILGLTNGIQPPASLFHGLWFIPFWLLSFGLLFLLAMTCGLLAFWLMTTNSLEFFLTGIILFLSGSVVPLWFFPTWMAETVRFLPFAWIGYYPTAVYLGKLDVAQTLTMFAIGLFWVALLATGVALLWSKARNRITVQGG